MANLLPYSSHHCNFKSHFSFGYKQLTYCTFHQYVQQSAELRWKYQSTNRKPQILDECYISTLNYLMDTFMQNYHKTLNSTMYLKSTTVGLPVSDNKVSITKKKLALPPFLPSLNSTIKFCQFHLKNTSKILAGSIMTHQHNGNSIFFTSLYILQKFLLL